METAAATRCEMKLGSPIRLRHSRGDQVTNSSIPPLVRVWFDGIHVVQQSVKVIHLDLTNSKLGAKTVIPPVTVTLWSTERMQRSPSRCHVQRVQGRIVSLFRTPPRSAPASSRARTAVYGRYWVVKNKGVESVRLSAVLGSAPAFTNP